LLSYSVNKKGSKINYSLSNLSLVFTFLALVISNLFDVEFLNMVDNSSNAPNIQLLLTGNELMTGDIVDSNSAMIAQQLLYLGLHIRKKVTVSDEMTDLVSEIQHLSQSADFLIINGGLGPTVDDLTAQALAEVAKVKIEQHPQALEHLQQWSKRRNFALNKPNLKQADLPAGCDIIDNDLGSAVGIKMTINDCIIYCTPGVPSELDVMLSKYIMQDIQLNLPNVHHYKVSRYQVFGIGESSLQKLINEQYTDWPKEIELGFRASMPLLELKLTCKSFQAEKELPACIKRLQSILGDHLVAQIDKKPLSFAKHIQSLLKDAKATITTAESCTGGMIASEITKESGSSDIFESGYVTYANRIKSSELGVNEAILQEHGAVSQQTVLAMAKGALAAASSDYVIATSGIAGPNGGTEEKPVGTVWIAWGSENNLQSVCLLLPGSRLFFQRYVTAISFDLIRRLLIGSAQVPLYIKERQVSSNPR